MKTRITIIALLLTSFAAQAHAAGTIPGPYVTKGKDQVSTDGFYGFETNDSSIYKFRERLTTDFGLTDDIGLRFRAVGEQDRNHNFRNDQLEAAIKYEIGNKGEYLVDSGMFFSLLQNTTDNHDSFFQFRYLLGKQTENWSHVANLVFTKKFGAELGTSTIAINFGSLRKLNSDFSLGYQYYGNYGKFDDVQIRDNSHSIGPWLKYTQEKYSVDFGVQFGLTDEEKDITLQWVLSVPFTTP